MFDPKKMPTAEELATDIVNSFTFPFPLTLVAKNKLSEKLFDSPPARSDLIFQIKNHDASAKTSIAPKQSDDVNEKDYDEIYCMIHNDFMPKSASDVEHADPLTDIIKRQTELLIFLNEQTPEYKKSFLEISDIKSYMREDPSDKKIKGSGLFYKICYNDANNLWLLCHSCNLNKSTKNFEDWFKDQENFGQPFLDHLQKNGGIQQGVILKRVYSRDSNTKVFSAKNSQEIVIHAGPKKGLGHFAREWFHNKHGATFKLHREYYANNYKFIKEELAKIRQYTLNGDDKNAKNALDSLKKTITEQHSATSASKTYHQTYEGSQGSGSDDSNDARVRGKYAMASSLIAAKSTTAFKSIRPLLKNYTLEQSEKIMGFLEEKMLGADVLNIIKKDLVSLFSKKNPLPDNVIVQIKQSIESYQAVLTARGQQIVSEQPLYKNNALHGQRATKRRKISTRGKEKIDAEIISSDEDNSHAAILSAFSRNPGKKRDDNDAGVASSSGEMRKSDQEESSSAYPETSNSDATLSPFSIDDDSNAVLPASLTCPERIDDEDNSDEEKSEDSPSVFSPTS